MDLRNRLVHRYRREIAADLHRRFDFRGHVAVIAVLVFAFGFLLNHFLLASGEARMNWRYFMAIMGSYAMFFVVIRVWLWYVGYDRSESDLDLFDGALPRPRIGTVDRAADVPPFEAGGGQFDGGGASGSWVDAGAPDAVPSAPVDPGDLAGTGDTGKSLFDAADAVDGDGAAPFLFVLVVIVAIIGIVGTAVYSVWMLPELLIDVSFEALLAAGLIRIASRIDADGWSFALLKQTAVPVFILLMICCGGATTLQKSYPEAKTMGDVIRKMKYG